MTKIVVVVDEAHKEIFEGEVKANTGPDVSIGGHNSTDIILKIYETVNGMEDNEIAAFKRWTYWRYIK